MGYVWYAGYGSNTLEERFLCYIRGGRFRLGGKPLDGCGDTTPPVDTHEFMVPHEMYFTGKSRYWSDGGTALLNPRPTHDESKFTHARIWKVTEEQFQDIWDQEGRKKHNLRLGLGWHADHCPIDTFTSSQVKDDTKPSEGYIQTIVLGLKETFAFNSRQSLDYLLRLRGIVGRIPADRLRLIVESANYDCSL